MTLLFDKDKTMPIQPGKTFDVPEEEVNVYPSGYKYLAWIEDRTGRTPKMDLGAHGPKK